MISESCEGDEGKHLIGSSGSFFTLDANINDEGGNDEDME